MKLATKDIDRFLTAPPPEVRAVLIYGVDPGMARERLNRLAKSAVADLSDPFLVADLDWDDLAKDPARLGDEAAQIALTGDRRVVRVHGVSEAAASLFSSFLAPPVPGDALILVAGGDLRKSAKLVKAFEESPVATALPCYPDEGRDLAQLVVDALRAQNSPIPPDALAAAVAHLGENRAVTRQEIDKLCLYVGTGNPVSVDDVEAVLADNAGHASDAIVGAAFSGEADRLDHAVSVAFREGVSPIALLRALSGYAMRLHQARTAVESGLSPSDAMKALRPPVFFKQSDAFKAQLRNWSSSALKAVLDLAADIETRSKQTGIPAEILCGRLLHQIAAMSKRERRPR